MANGKSILKKIPDLVGDLTIILKFNLSKK